VSLDNKISEDLKIAMKAGDKLRVEVLRGIKSQCKYYQIEKKVETNLSDTDMLSVIAKMLKQRKDSITEFQKANRMDLVEKEQGEYAILKSYMPEEISSEDLGKIVREVIAETGATDKKQMGQVMKAVLAKTKGRVDGKEVNRLVGELLG
jgi:uncharacterized protein